MIAELYKHFQKHPTVCTDTRDIKPGSIFFALKGGNFNANEFAAQALEKGCSLAVIDEEKYNKGEGYFLVDDVLKTLQQLANYHRKQVAIPVISITGSNGKTTSKELLYAVLSQKYKVLATKGNLNNHIGVPLTLLSITTEHQMAIIEMGANHQGEIAELCTIADPDFGMITNIGKAHLEGFGGVEGVIKGKTEMYRYIKQKGGKLFVNIDNALLKQHSDGIERITYGKAEDADYIGFLTADAPFVSLKFKSKQDTTPLDQKTQVNTHLVGVYNFENILAAACIGNYFKVSELEIKAGLEGYIPSNNRSQVMKTAKNVLLLDAYNANPSSMNAAIENFAQMQAENKMVILGDMLELGDDSEKEHDTIVNLLQQKNIYNTILVGPHFEKAGKKLNLKTFPNSDAVLTYLQQQPVTNNHILIKGSRGIKLEKVVEAL